MSNRRIIIHLLVAILIVAGIHAVLVMRGSPSTALRQRRVLLETADGHTSVTIERPTRRALRLAKANRWHLVEPFPAKVDETRVLKLLDALAFTLIDDTLTDAELLKLSRVRADFALDEPRLAVTVAAGERKTRILFGSATPSGGGVYAAVEGVDAVFVVPSNVCAAVDVTADVLRRRSLFLLGSDEVDSLDLKRGSGSFLRFRRDGEKWRVTQPRESPAATARVKKFVGDVLAAEAVDFVWPVGTTNEVESVSASLLAGYGLDPESAVTVTFKGIDGNDRWISFGKDAAEGLVYALAQNGGAIVTVNARLREQAAADATLFVDTRLFPLEVTQITTVSLTDGDTAYMLARDGDAGWRLDSPVVAPADAETVRALLSRLLELRTVDVSTDGVQVSLATNLNPVTVARAAAVGGMRLDNLRSRTVLKVQRGEVRRLVATGTDGKASAVVYDRERKAWKVETEAEGGSGVVALSAVEGVLAELEAFQAVRVECVRVEASALGRYGLDQPVLKLAVDLERDETVRRNVLVGAAADGGRYVTVGSSDAVFVVPQATVDRLMQPLVTQP